MVIESRQIIDIATEYQVFFTKVIATSTQPGDIERARYGLEESKHLLAIVERNASNLQNSVLKRIHNTMVNISRGVEYFSDTKSEQEKRELENRLYIIKKSIEGHIKW